MKVGSESGQDEFLRWRRTEKSESGKLNVKSERTENSESESDE